MIQSLRFFKVLILLLVVAWIVFSSDSMVSAQCQNNSSFLHGKWRGTWLSYTNGHNGRLRGRFRQINSSQVRATFTGTFAKVIPFGYITRLNIVHQESDLMILSGSKRLGPIMGRFEYEAVITPHEVISNYRSRRDSGRWYLRRR